MFVSRLLPALIRPHKLLSNRKVILKYIFLLWIQDDVDDDWFPEDIFEAFKELRKRKVFDVTDMYTIADVWGWTWERELKNRPPQRWSQEWEVELAIKVMLKASSYILYSFHSSPAKLVFFLFSPYFVIYVLFVKAIPFYRNLNN